MHLGSQGSMKALEGFRMEGHQLLFQRGFWILHAIHDSNGITLRYSTVVGWWWCVDKCQGNLMLIDWGSHPIQRAHGLIPGTSEKTNLCQRESGCATLSHCSYWCSQERCIGGFDVDVPLFMMEILKRLRLSPPISECHLSFEMDGLLFLVSFCWTGSEAQSKSLSSCNVARDILSRQAFFQSRVDMTRNQAQ